MGTLARTVEQMKRSINRMIVPRLLAGRCNRGLVNVEAMRHVAVYPRLGIAYNRIKKNANSTTVVLLREIESGSVEREREAKLNSLHLEKMPIAMARRIGDWTFFTIVRNPYTRVVSAFFNKFAKEAYRSRYEGFDLSPDGFRRFVYWLRDGAITEDPHWDLQTKLLLMPLAGFDRVIRFERFADELETFLVARGIVLSDQNRASLHPGARAAAPRGDSRLAECYTPEVAETVARLYERDFDELGYSRVIPS